MKPLLLCVLICLTSAPSFAQTTLDPIVVTATRILQPLSKVTASVSVIDVEQLRRSGVRTVAEALRSVSGAAVVQSGSYGANTTLFLRGGESDYTQVLLDGVQINSPGEQFNFSNLSIENIERIEIVKGPASVLYGSDAVTGVVQLFTKQRTGRPAGTVALSAGRGDRVGAQAEGSFDNALVRAELAGGTQRAGYSLGVSHFDTDGAYAFNNEHRTSSLTARGRYSATNATQLSGSFRIGSSRFHYPTDGTGQLNDQNQHQDAHTVALGIDVEHRFSPRLDLSVGFRHNQNNDETIDLPDHSADTLGFFRYVADQRYRRQDVDARLNYRAGANTFTIGSELEWQTSRGSSSSPFGDAPETTDTRDNRAAYAQWLSDFNRVSLQLGVRGEHNDRFGDIATYRGGVALRVSPELRARVSAGTAFKEPRFFEQFATGFVRGNPDLDPETSRSIDAGIDASIGATRLSATWFHQQFEDLILYIFATATPTDPNYTNIAGARASGLELSADHAWRRLSFNASYTLLDTRVTDEGDGSDDSFQEGEQLLRRPRHSASLRASLNLAHTALSLSANYVGKRSELDFATFPATRVTLESYVRMDAAVRVRVSRAFALTARLENALDESYQEVLNFPAPERVVYVGAQVAF